MDANKTYGEMDAKKMRLVLMKIISMLPIMLSKRWRRKVKIHIFQHMNYTLCYIVAAILVVGGVGSKTTIKKSVEALTPDGIPLCTLPDLPEERFYHTMDDHILCGGYNSQSSCLYYVAGKWTKYRNDLKFKRTIHVSWRRQDNEVILFGGEYSKKTSEVVSSSGQQEGFNLQHEVL